MTYHVPNYIFEIVPEQPEFFEELNKDPQFIEDVRKNAVKKRRNELERQIVAAENSKQALINELKDLDTETNGND